MVVLACNPRLTGLLRRLPGLDDVVPGDQPPPPTAWHCSLYCQPRLAGLLRRCPGVGEVAPNDGPAPPAGWTCALLDVPVVLGVDLDSIPADGPYLPLRRRIPPARPR